MLDKIGYYLARLQMKMRMSSIRNSAIHRTSTVEAGSQVVDTQMGRHSFCGYNCTLLNCEIGSFCSISDFVYIGGSQHPMHFVSTSPVFLSHRDSVRKKFSRHAYRNMPRTTIGSDVWIGHGAKVRAGVTIGHGAVIGMGAVVAKSIAPYEIVVGNPGRVVRKRFSDDVVSKLLQLEWWKADDVTLQRYAQHFQEPDALLRMEGLL